MISESERAFLSGVSLRSPEEGDNIIHFDVSELTSEAMEVFRDVIDGMNAAYRLLPDRTKIYGRSNVYCAISSGRIAAARVVRTHFGDSFIYVSRLFLEDYARLNQDECFTHEHMGEPIACGFPFEIAYLVGAEEVHHFLHLELWTDGQVEARSKGFLAYHSRPIEYAALRFKLELARKMKFGKPCIDFLTEGVRRVEQYRRTRR